MPITESNFANFYLGTAAELLVASQFYARGYEALRMAPDAGIDYLVTNRARRKFLSEPPKDIEVQVKSAFAYEGEVRLTVTQEEFTYLTLRPDRFLVIVIFSHFARTIDPQTANYLGRSADRSLETYIAEFENAEMNRDGWKKKIEDPNILFEFDATAKTFVWLNSSHLSRGLRDGAWRAHPKSRIAIKLN